MLRISAGGMRRLVLVAGLALVVAACGNQEEAQQAEREEQWEQLQEAKAELDARRAELAELESQLATIHSGDAESGDAESGDAESGDAESGDAESGDAESGEQEAGPSAEELEAEIARLEQEIRDQADQFGSDLVEFINANPIVAGQEPTEQQVAALRMKSHEDMLVAQEFIDEAGDYRRAIEIYEQALAVDPDNPELKQALEEAHAKRYMTEDRFAQVDEGMTQDEVRSVLGPVNLRNVREYPDRDVVAWFYPREDGGAAGVFFNRAGDGAYAVYELDFEAVASEPEGGAE